VELMRPPHCERERKREREKERERKAFSDDVVTVYNE
jgi:hypothetical protein